MEQKKSLADKILQALDEGGDYVSGQELCDRFGVSRTAVWKAVKTLKEKGYCFEALQNKGYRLIETPDSIEGAEIRKHLKTRWAGCKIHYFPETGSTNADAKRYAEKRVR